MPRIKDLLDPEVREETYAFKDVLKNERLLKWDFRRMDRDQFERYLSAKAAAIVQEQTDRGAPIEAAYHKARVTLTFEDSVWRRLND